MKPERITLSSLLCKDERKFLNTYEEIISWIKLLNSQIHVEIRKTALENMDFWFYDRDTGEIVNKDRSFFQIKGIELKGAGRDKTQPIIIQNEIGYLGMICKEFNGALHFLMQAKIEPGNLNKIQLSPTIQATKSNFTQKHGGSKPRYLSYFLNAGSYCILADQIQSEQSSRFLKKRNRNIIIKLDDDDIQVLPNFKWISFYQLKRLMAVDNLVNMDTRTVLSGIPYFRLEQDIKPSEAEDYFTDISLYHSMREPVDMGIFSDIYHYINNYKMFDESETALVPLYSLNNWEEKNGEFVCKEPYNFKLIFCDIEIEGREVKRWSQPLFAATGIATFGLFTCKDGGIRKFLVKAKPEIGCFDRLELAPSVQKEFVEQDEPNEIERLFEKLLKNGENILYDHYLSEEGGRFYQEQNRNVILEIDKKDIPSVPQGYFWVDYALLNRLIQINNCLNIQLRNLLAVLPF